MEYIKNSSWKKYADCLQELLDRENIDFYEEKIGKDSVIDTFTTVFEDGREVDIKVCSGDSNCFIDAVILDKNGCEIEAIEPQDSLLEEYFFEVDNVKYIVLLKAK